ncbi:MAG: DUF1499 domain-containing protein [Verrucomicrobia bacterium]|nr:DUF1499 domain-containing protein [Verrucomicrobiota bacterium]
MSSQPASHLVDGRLAPCGEKPNCVCSQDDRPEHFIEPLTFTNAPSEAWARLVSVVLNQPRTTLVQETPEYLRVEFRSRLFRFVDDVEFLLQPTNRTIEVRSASRVGHSDLGVNRARVERIRTAFASAQSAEPRPTTAR